MVSLGVEWVRRVAHASHVLLTPLPDTFLRLQRSRFLVFSAEVFTETGNQTRILATSRRTLESGV
jgi:hypothetical protein